jgi:hypothetical protein
MSEEAETASNVFYEEAKTASNVFYEEAKTASNVFYEEAKTASSLIYEEAETASIAELWERAIERLLAGEEKNECCKSFEKKLNKKRTAIDITSVR